jgi:hypothetical protein
LILSCKFYLGVVVTNLCLSLFRLNRLRPDAGRDVAIAATNNHFTFLRYAKRDPTVLSMPSQFGGKFVGRTKNRP